MEIMMIVYLQTDCIQNTPPLQIVDSKLVIQLSNQCAFYLATRMTTSISSEAFEKKTRKLKNER